MKKKLLKWLLRRTQIELSAGTILAITQMSMKIVTIPGTVLEINEPDGQVITIKVVNKRGGCNVNIKSPLRPSQIQSLIGAVPPFGEMFEFDNGMLKKVDMHMEPMAPMTPTAPIPPTSAPTPITPTAPASAPAPKPDIPKDEASQVAKIPIAMKAIAIAVRNGWTLHKAQPKTSMIQFVNAHTKLNVYWTDRNDYTVATSMDHPSKGKIQLFRKRVSEKLLEKICADPRVHTGKGYYETK